MKAIHKNKVYHVEDEYGDVIVLSREGERIEVPLSDPFLIIDPTDYELRYAS
jgi:hypothetical protein